MPIATAQITIMDLSDIYINNTPPQKPIVDQIWLDTSVEPNLFKKWNGTEWVIVNDVVIGGKNYFRYSSTTLFKDNASLNNYWTSSNLALTLESTVLENAFTITMPSNVSGTSYTYIKDAVKRKVKIQKDIPCVISMDLSFSSNCKGYRIVAVNSDTPSQTTTICEGTTVPSSKGLSNKLVAKFKMPYATTEFRIYNQGVKSSSTQSNSILAYNNIMLEIGTINSDFKLAQEDIDEILSNLENRVTQAEINVTPDRIISTVMEATTSGGETLFAKKSEVTQLSDKVNNKFTSVGGKNLLKNSSFINGTNSWTNWGLMDEANIKTESISYKDFSKALVINIPSENRGVYQRIENVDINSKYVLSAYVYSSASQQPGIQLFDGGNVYNSSYKTTTEGWELIETTIIAKNNFLVVQLGRGTGGTNCTNAKYTGVMLQKADTKTGEWTPHKDEVYIGNVNIDMNGLLIEHSDIGTATRIASDGFYIYNSKGETVGSLASETGLSIINADNIYANNISQIYTGPNEIYVDHSTNDIVNDGSLEHPFKNFYELRMLLANKTINKQVTVNIVSTGMVIENLVIENIYGTGKVKLMFNSTLILYTRTMGSINTIDVQNCTAEIAINGGKKTISTSDGLMLVSGKSGVGVTNCKNVTVEKCRMSGYAGMSPGVHCISSLCTMLTIDFMNSSPACRISNNSVTYLNSCCGSGRNSIEVTTGGICTCGQTRPKGFTEELTGTIYLKNSSESESVNPVPPELDTGAGEYKQFSITACGYYSPVFQKWNDASDNYIYQGRINGDNRIGALKFDDAAIRSWLANSSNDTAGSTITLKRSPTVGTSTYQNIYLYGTDTDIITTPGAPNLKYRYGNIGALKWGQTGIFNLPTSVISHFKSGSIKALLIYDDSGSNGIKLEPECILNIKKNK